MRNKLLKSQAISLRKQGLSYSEINSKIAVSKSTLSYWLREVSISESKRKQLRRRIGMSQPKAARAHKEKRIKRTKEIIKKAKKEIKFIDDERLFYLGVALYWAEGSKQKEYNVGQRVTFNNSDPLMIKIYIKWLLQCLKLSKDELDFEIYSHNNIRDREVDVVKYWSSVTNFPASKFKKVYYKKDKKKEYRKNKGRAYNGLLRVNVLKSTDLNRRITGWVESICEHCRVV